MRILLSLLILFPLSSQACDFEPSKKTFEERIRAAQIAFDGVVIDVSPDHRATKFQVLRWINGEELAKSESTVIDGLGYYTIHSSGSTCDIRFVVGEHWLYGGSTFMSPSKIITP